MAAADRRRRLPDSLRRELLDLAGERCAICHRSLRIDDVKGKKLSYIAEIAHIVAVSPGGERGDETRPMDIDAVDNLIPLCPSDHKMIDKPGIGRRLYSVEKLRALKVEHEAWVALERTRPPDELPASAPPLDVRPGGVVTVSERRYRLAEDLQPGRIEGAFSERRSSNGDAVRSEAHAYAETGDAGHVWLRRVATRGAMSEGAQWRRELTDEAAVLAGRLEPVPGLPRLLAVETTPTVAILVTGLPSLTSVAERFSGRGAAEEAVRALFSGVHTLCDALGALHDEGFAHGALDPATLLVDRRGHLLLRDLGLATALGDHGGSAQDLWTLAAIIYRCVTGSPPAMDGAPVLATVLNPVVSERAATALDHALSGKDGDVRDLGRELRAAVAGPRRRGP